MGYPFNCNGGQVLSRIGASFFVSYLYYLKVDKNHLAWDTFKNKSLKRTRIKLINRSSIYYKDWIDYIIAVIVPSPLQRNKIGLTDADVVDLAKKLVPYV